MVISIIRGVKPDILVVAFGTPLQEKWIEKNLEKLGIPLCIGAGAAIDFLSGNIPRAPVWMQRAGLEWFFRLVLEPRRLWRRYLVRDTKFIYLLLCQLLGRK
jgi:N-acetylglucosaminyldiphosphoundecaprenol N-acetyl-beta-D-mannosaminyltransferase